MDILGTKAEERKEPESEQANLVARVNHLSQMVNLMVIATMVEFGAELDVKSPFCSAEATWPDFGLTFEGTCIEEDCSRLPGLPVRVSPIPSAPPKSLVLTDVAPNSHARLLG